MYLLCKGVSIGDLGTHVAAHVPDTIRSSYPWRRFVCPGEKKEIFDHVLRCVSGRKRHEILDGDFNGHSMSRELTGIRSRRMGDLAICDILMILLSRVSVGTRLGNPKSGQQLPESLYQLTFSAYKLFWAELESSREVILKIGVALHRYLALSCNLDLQYEAS